MFAMTNPVFGQVTKPSPGGCRSGLPFKLLTSSGTHVTAKLGITLKEAGDHYTFCLKVDPVDYHDKDDMRRLGIRVNKEGKIVSRGDITTTKRSNGDSCFGEGLCLPVSLSAL